MNPTFKCTLEYRKLGDWVREVYVLEVVQEKNSKMYYGMMLGADNSKFFGETLDSISKKFIDYVDFNTKGDKPSIIGYDGYAAKVNYLDDNIVATISWDKGLEYEVTGNNLEVVRKRFEDSNPY